jgi:cytochrome c peroxidase
MTFRRAALAAFALLVSVAAGAGGWWTWLRDPEPSLAELKAQYARPAEIPFPEDNPYTPAKAELGKQLFFDQRLSGNNDISCAGCHMPEQGWEDGKPVAQSPTGEPQRRHSPTLWNVAWIKFFFWDGRSRSLEDQASRPVLAQGEMNQPMPSLLAELRAVQGYRKGFAEAFPDDPAITEDNMVKAIATYERTIVQPTTPFDAWVAGTEDAISESAKRGFALFNGKAKCVNCHAGWNFTQNAFHDIGLAATEDKGRGPVIGVDAVNFAFKAPTLRDIARRAPYMHDGRFATLRQAIEHYEGPFPDRPSLSADLATIDLSDRETDDLIAFLKTLTTPEPLQGVTRPELPQ